MCVCVCVCVCGGGGGGGVYRHCDLTLFFSSLVLTVHTSLTTELGIIMVLLLALVPEPRGLLLQYIASWIMHEVSLGTYYNSFVLLETRIKFCFQGKKCWRDCVGDYIG